jgi:hypothetical protein
MTIFNPEALQERARNLGTHNGLRLLLVTLQPPGNNPVAAQLEVHFYNANELANIVNDVAGNAALTRQIFPISGGHRRLAGPATGQVQVTAVAAGPAAHILLLTVAPIGDYSTYTLGVEYQNMDPIFSTLHFKFRPGCFTTDCAPEWEKAPAPKVNPVIDYLAKDYESFRHTLIAAMSQRVPGWRPTSEADLDQVLLELFSAAADELSDYQDRVMNEAYLGTARKRVSLARHARLMDYHIHQGNQASTWLALQLAPGQNGTLPAGVMAWTGPATLSDASQVFVSRTPARVHSLLSRMGLYTWSDAIPALAAGSTTADLRLTSTAQIDANTVRDLIRSGAITHLLLQEWLNPATGQPPGRDPSKRQTLELLPGDAGAASLQDPLTGAWFVRVRWAEKDQLKHNYCFVINCPPPVGRVADVSLFHGNLVQVYHGRPAEAHFFEPETLLTAARQFYFERTDDGTDRWGTLCRLPDGPLAYQNTSPGGEVPPRSTLAVRVELPGGAIDLWDERISLIHSDDSSENGDHYSVETDEEGRSLIRFGNGTNGRKLPPGAMVHCTYQIGRGLDGNVGADTVVHYAAGFSALLDQATIWNPFDVTDGTAPEPAAEIIRRVPEAYRVRQLRAVTLQDYVRRAEELPGVARAAARYAWTGSWRTVRLTIDPAGTTMLDETLRRQVAQHLEAVRLLGEDLEIRPPRFVPLAIDVALCIHPEYWPEDVQFVLAQEFSEGYTPDGRLGFFHPDHWTFGQELHASQIIGRLQAIEGVAHIISVTMKRWDEATAGTDAIVALRANEIIRVRNDPDHMEEGFIAFDVRGGRQ